MKKLLKGQKGIGGILILLAVVFIIVAIVVMAYFLLKDSAKKAEEAKKQANQQQDKNRIITSDEVPLKICATGDPEQCDDPISNEDVDNIVVDDLP